MLLSIHMKVPIASGPRSIDLIRSTCGVLTPIVAAALSRQAHRRQGVGSLQALSIRPHKGLNNRPRAPTSSETVRTGLSALVIQTR